MSGLSNLRDVSWRKAGSGCCSTPAGRYSTSALWRARHGEGHDIRRDVLVDSPLIGREQTPDSCARSVGTRDGGRAGGGAIGSLDDRGGIKKGELVGPIDVCGMVEACWCVECPRLPADSGCRCGSGVWPAGAVGRAPRDSVRQRGERVAPCRGQPDLRAALRSAPHRGPLERVAAPHAPADGYASS